MQVGGLQELGTEATGFMLFRQLEVGNVKKSDSSVAWVRGEAMVISTRWFGDL